MTVLSCLKNLNGLSQKIVLRAAEGQINALKLSTSAIKNGGGRDKWSSTLQIRPSLYWWQHYKDDLHFYTMLGLVPGLIIVFLTNVFIGPSTIHEIPEGYVPKKWEYYRHPITRWIASLKDSNQEIHERNLWYINEEDQKMRMRLMHWKVMRLMRERGDYPNYYGTDAKVGSIARMFREQMDEMHHGTAGYASRTEDTFYHSGSTKSP